MKKILVLNYEFPPLWGWGWVATEKLCKWWIKLGYKVDVVTSDYENLQKKENINEICVYRVKTFWRKEKATATMLSMLTYVIFAIPQVIFLAWKNKYEFVNTQFVVPTGPVGYIVSKIFWLKNIISIHGWDIYDPSKKSSPHKSKIYKKIIQFLFKNAFKIVAQSKNTKENALKYYGNYDIEIIPLAFEKPSFTNISKLQLWLQEDVYYFISIGRLVARKWYTYLLEAMSRLHIDNCKLLLIWDGPEKHALQEQAQKLNIVDRVVFLWEILDDNKKYQYMSYAEMYILSSLHEWFWIVLQEAMEVWLPIVSTNNGWQTDFLIDGENALLLEIENSKLLAEKIQSLYEDIDLRRKMGINNTNKIRQFYIDEIAKKYLELI